MTINHAFSTACCTDINTSAGVTQVQPHQATIKVCTEVCTEIIIDA